MADISYGPVSSMPGSRHAMPDGAECDEHPGRPAVQRVQGETDSFGCEFLDLCRECLDDLTKHREDARRGVCDWCHMEASDLRPARDYDEGMTGRLYDVCGSCVRKRDDEAREEIERLDAELGIDGSLEDNGG